MGKFATIAPLGLVLVLASCSATVPPATPPDDAQTGSVSTPAATPEIDAESDEASGAFIASSDPAPCESDMPKVVLDTLAAFRGTAEAGFLFGKSALEQRGLGPTVRMDCGYTFENPQSGVQIRLTEGGREEYANYAYYGLEEFATGQGEVFLSDGTRATWSTSDDVKFYDETLPFSTTLMSFWIPDEFSRTGNSMTVSMAAIDKPGGTPLTLDEMTRLANALLEDVPTMYEAFFQQYLEDNGYDE